VRGLGQGARDNPAQAQAHDLRLVLVAWVFFSGIGYFKNFHTNLLQVSDPRLFFGWYMAGAILVLRLV
jgi:hypothetical protein